jgi:hypothetical protein
VIQWIGKGLAGWVVVLASLPAADLENLYQPHPPVRRPAEGISWPAGQALPIFSRPSDQLDALVVQDLTRDEQITFSALQGRVNRRQPRLLLLNARAGEGRDTWSTTPTVDFRVGKFHGPAGKYALLGKYAAEMKGVVLYDPAKSPHYRNLAGTAAGRHGALPVTPEIHAKMIEAGIRLPVIEDLTRLEFTTPLEIYRHLRATYWPHCEKRLILSAKPHDERGGGDYHHTRDLAAATGAAVVWLDTLIPAERDLLREFFRDMKAGEAVALGWYATERSGISTASEFGIGTLPADHFSSATVFSGTDPRIRIPPVPRMPPLEKKVHIAIFISDGDNIQYTQHAMRQGWDRTAQVRGRMPLSWTIAPGLVDIAPGILNHYYTQATANDCFVTGPSGMGYLMPVNTLRERGARVGVNLTDPARMDGYARLTATYLQRSGLRVATIWDDATPMHRAAYERHCRQLLGATVQNFRDVPGVASSVEKDRLRFEKLVIPYAGSHEHLHGSITEEIGKWDGEGPHFLAYQADVWGRLSPERLVALHDQVLREHPGKVRFVRADHFFNLQHRAAGRAYDLCLSPETTAAGAGEVVDGTPVTCWQGSADERSVTLGFGGPRRVHRCVIHHAGAAGMDRANNSRALTLEAQADDGTWQEIGRIRGNADDVSDVEFPPVRAKALRVTVTDAGADAIPRIAELQVYGRDA